MQKELENTISKISKKFEPIELVRNIKSGKEATVYLVRSKSSFYALKVYKTNVNLASRQEYTLGKHIREKSLRRAVASKNNIGRELVRKLWTKREFYMLQKFHSLGACVPQVFEFTDDSILMEYLGDTSLAAPRLIDVELSHEESKKAYDAIVSSMKMFLECGVVHGDLSAYNILWWKNKPYIIDFPQCIDVKRNSNWEEIYERDLNNISKYFKQNV